MNLMAVLSGKGFVMYNKELAHKISVNGAIIFGQLCSSYESFGSKGMLTIREGKEYFFLTIEVLGEETALSYKQQMKAVKELEEAGYIETRNMGVPQKRHFHITDKIVKELLSSSDKREELNIPSNSAPSNSSSTPILDKRERLVLPKGNDNTCQKVSNIKKKNKKEQYKDNNINFVNKESVNKDEIINKLISEYRLKGLSKEVCLRVLDEVNANPNVENFGAYLRGCLENTLYKSKLKRGEIDFSERFQSGTVRFYDWLSANDKDELPY
jgi:DNA-binding PadR family transcriptional regulator